MTSSTIDRVSQHAVVIFDGECGFCDGWIQFLLRFDRKEAFRFCARQSEAGAAISSRIGLPPGGVGSIVVVEGKRIHLRSGAVLRMLSLLGFPFSLIGVLRWIPERLRDAGYDLIARNRKRWFGGVTQCRVPAPSERHRFL